ncbi:glycoside hydrolase family 3 N-terminal domain-containing protein [Streptomyces sp. NPDC002012]|uniref:glycoside hydrolase family 3 N-terminal domain-containing protein n=1 Tax=Streptomyces sp. NPDC002012 TaxID=3154532 RepID=UPI003319BB9B
MCVMAGSHTVRALDDRPALASRRVLGLLRDDLGFNGVVVSENLSIPVVSEPLGGLAKAAGANARSTTQRCLPRPEPCSVPRRAISGFTPRSQTRRWYLSWS